MPRISYFFGISIYMFYSDHAPPHVHAMYNDYGAVVAVQTGEVLDGKLPPRALRLVREWVTEHLSELMADWELARKKEPLVGVPPLE
jgi:hypothetical protein